MTTKTIKETIREYDKNGNLIKEIVTETSENIDNDLEQYSYPPRFYYNSPDGFIACYIDDLK